MDLNSIEIPDTAVIEIEHPRGGKLNGKDGKPCTITVYGPASDRAIEYDRKNKKRIFDRIGKKGAKGLASMSAEEAEEYALDRLSTLTAAVSGIEIGGKPVTPENIRSVYAEPKYGWLRQQVEEKLSGWDDFLA